MSVHISTYWIFQLDFLFQDKVLMRGFPWPRCCSPGLLPSLSFARGTYHSLRLFSFTWIIVWFPHSVRMASCTSVLLIAVWPVPPHTVPGKEEVLYEYSLAEWMDNICESDHILGAVKMLYSFLYYKWVFAKLGC